MAEIRASAPIPAYSHSQQANLVYGTRIPACIIVRDKEKSAARRGIFMMDVSKGFIKDDPKNRLREQDIHRIVDAFSRLNDSDPRYIESTGPEDTLDITAHLSGGIPQRDIDALSHY